jgi:hypothetical protein
MEKESNTKNKFGRILKSFAFILFVAVIVASLMLVNPTPINVWVSILNISVLALSLLLVWSLSKEFSVVTVFSIILNSILLVLMLVCFYCNQHPKVTYEKVGFIKTPNQAKVISGISQHLILKDVSNQVQVEYKDDKGETKVKTFNITQDSAIQIANAQNEGKDTTILSIAKYKKVYVVKLPWNTVKYKPSSYKILNHQYRPATDKGADKVNDELYYIYLKNE